jgi:two-component system, chemotaxis family, CheB/CheR fusion protein
MIGPKPHKRDVTVVVPRRILVVDDFPTLTEGLAKWLRGQGHDVEVAFDGLQALEAAERFQPDIILLDINMPGLDGYETAQRIRRQPWGKEIVLVALTGYGREEDRSRIRDVGFNAHLVKPLVYKQVAALLASYSSPALTA